MYSIKDVYYVRIGSATCCIHVVEGVSMEEIIGEWIYQEVPLPFFHLDMCMSMSHYNVTVLAASKRR
jgi:hypothetical protein